MIDAQLLGTYQTEFLGDYLGLASMRAIWRTGCAKVAQRAAERCASWAGDVRGKLQSEYGASQRAEWEHVAGAIIHADKRFFTSRCSSSRIVFTMPVASLLEHYALISKRGLRETQEGERLGGREISKMASRLDDSLRSSHSLLREHICCHPAKKRFCECL